MPPESVFCRLNYTFLCPQSRIVRVLNLWQKNNVFTPEVIQPLLDMASLANKDQLVTPSNGVQAKTPPISSASQRSGRMERFSDIMLNKYDKFRVLQLTFSVPAGKPSPVKDVSWLGSDAGSSITSTPQPKPVNYRYIHAFA